MKILFVDRFFYPDLQATSVMLTDLVRAISGHFEVSVISGPPSKFRTGGGSGISNIRHRVIPAFGMTHFTRMERVLNYSSFLFFAFLNVLFSQKIEAVISQSSPPLLPFVTALACRLRGFRYVYICQDLFPETAVKSGNLKEGIFAGFLRSLDRYAIRAARRVVAIGRDMKEELIFRGTPEKKIALIPNWSDPGEIQVLPRRNSFSDANGLSDYFTVMHAGNFGLVQDFDFLVNVAAALVRDSGIRFVFVGGGATKKAVSEEIRRRGLPNVLFLDFQDRSKLSEVLASADLHVVSLKKGLAGFSVPSKIYSLLASGRPICGFLETKSEVAYLISEAACGVVMENVSAEEAADFIRKLAKKPEELAAWGHHARQFAERENFRASAFRAYKSLIEEVLS